MQAGPCISQGVRVIRCFEALSSECRHAVVAIGNFDGIHRGHQRVLGETQRLAREGGAPFAVLTFQPHPRRIFSPQGGPLALLPLAEKMRQLRKMGVEILYLARFTKALADQTAGRFIDDVLIRQLAVRQVVTGENFVFGKNRGGNAALLAAQPGFGYRCVPGVKDASGRPVSSTHIRMLLKEGDIRGASALLGRPYSLSGRVCHGDGRGRALGVPTANLMVHDLFLPAFGVYTARVDGVHKAVANLGVRPTVGGGAPRLEVHLLDYSGDLYGSMLTVELVEYLRPERAFESMEALKAQIVQDVVQAREKWRE